MKGTIRRFMYDLLGGLAVFAIPLLVIWGAYGLGLIKLFYPILGKSLKSTGDYDYEPSTSNVRTRS